MKMLFIRFLAIGTKDPTISLVFYIQKFCRIKPVSGFVFGLVSENSLCYGFSHHAARIPNSFHRTAVSNRFTLFCAVSYSVNILDIRFKKPGRGMLTVEFNLSQAQIDDIRRKADTHYKVEPRFLIEVKDESGDVVTVVDKLLYVRRKDKKPDPNYKRAALEEPAPSEPS